jgi:hypothetical protein
LIKNAAAAVKSMPPGPAAGAFQRQIRPKCPVDFARKFDIFTAPLLGI